MKISEKVKMDRDGLEEHGPITIVAFGDSITHGGFNDGEMDYDLVYWNRLRMKINENYKFIPVNVINAGIGGLTAHQSVARIDRQVLAHNPDLVIVCFGLNDVNVDKSIYLGALSTIFERCKASGAEVIFMSPNMLNTYVSEETSPMHLSYAARMCKIQTSGRMDEYMADACALARECGVAVCDCYSKWKELSKTQDTTLLLANRINHPTREMHKLFSDSLYEVIFAEENQTTDSENDTMYKE